MLHEHRLLRLTQRELDAQRKAAGQTPISTAKPTSVATNPTKVASASATGTKPTNTLLTQTDRMSAAEANANLQNIQRANTLSTKEGTVKTVDPTTGQLVEQNVLGVQYQNTDKGVNAAMNLAQQGGQTAGYTSPYAVPTMGVIDQTALKRLMDSGMSQSDALASLQGNRPDVQQAFNEVGTNRTPDKTLAEKRAEELAGIKGYRTVTKYDANGNPYSFNEIDLQKTEELKSEAQKRWAIEDQTTVQNRSNEQKSLAGRNAGAAMENSTNGFDEVSPSSKTPLTFGAQPKTKAQLDQNAIEFARSQGMSDEEIQSRIESGTLPPAPEGQTYSEPSKTPTFGTQSTQDTQTSTTGKAGSKTQQGSTEQQPAPVPPVNTELGALNAAITAAFAGNPLGEVYKQSIMQDYQAEQQKMANALASRDASITQAAVDNSDTQAFIEKWAGKATANTNVLTSLLKNINNDTNKYLNEQKSNDLDRLAFDKQVGMQKMEKQKADDILKSSISMALSGGAFSGAGQNQLAETEREWDVSIQNLAKEYSFKAADVGTFYTQKYVEAKNQLSLDLYNASTALDAKIEGYANQGFASLKAKQNAEKEARNAYRTEVNSILTDHSNNLKGYIKDIGTQITANKTEKLQKETSALDKIQYLSANYAPELVADTIKELAKDVTSFDASALAGMAPIDLQTKMAALRKKTGGGSGGGFYMPSSTPTPAITYDEFIKGKIEEKEADSSMSMTSQERKAYLEANKANFMAEYQASTMGSPQDVTSSGDPAVDEVAGMVVSGIYANAKEASNESGLPSVAIARQVKAMQDAGAGGGAVPMNPKQQSNFLSITKALDIDPITVFARSVPYKVSAIKLGLAKKNGAADILAINNYQNGLVDPGAVTRSEDVTLLAERAAPILAKYSSSYWKERFASGGILPEVERQQLLDIASELEQATVQAYQNGPYNNFVSKGRALSIPEANLNLFRNVSASTSNVDMQPVSSFTSEFGYD